MADLPLLIPLRSDLPAFTTQVQLEGTTYTLSFRWNTRGQAWFMVVLNDEADTVLVGETRCVVGFPINAYLTGRQPPGVFVFDDTSRQGKDPGLTDLGGRVQLVYLPSTALA